VPDAKRGIEQGNGRGIERGTYRSYPILRGRSWRKPILRNIISGRAAG
jgi:hypothetical protein